MASLVSNRKFLEEYNIFLGSSSEAKPLTALIVEELNRELSTDKDGLKLNVVPWYDHFDDEAKLINTLFLEEFPHILEKCDFSLFIISKDDFLIKRKETKKTVRDNVWFEAGMFMGKRGRNRTFFFLNSNDFNEIHFPTDINGLTLPGVKWDADIADLYFKKSPLFEKHKVTKDAVELKIKNEINRLIKKLIERIKDEIKKSYVSEEAIIIYDRKRCFEQGVKLVENAQERLYTTISFSKSLSPTPSTDEKEMQDKLEECIKKKEASFIRFMKSSLPNIKKQWDILENLVKKVNPNPTDVYLRDINFDYLELIVSDNNVLMVFPDFRDDDKNLQEKVAFGFLIKESKELADVLSAWLIKKIK